MLDRDKQWQHWAVCRDNMADGSGTNYFSGWKDDAHCWVWPSDIHRAKVMTREEAENELRLLDLHLSSYFYLYILPIDPQLRILEKWAQEARAAEKDK